MASALFFLFLMLLGALLFLAAVSISLGPAVQRAAFELCALPSKKAINNDECARKLNTIRRIFVSKKVRIMQGRLKLSGWLFLPAAQGMNVDRILILAPEGRPISAADLSLFLDAGFLSRAGGGPKMPAVFLPSPSKPFAPPPFFSFGAKEEKALAAWGSFFGRSLPLASLFFCGKGAGASSALFAAARLGRRAAGSRCNLGGVIAQAPCLSATEAMKRLLRKRFPRRAIYIPVYAGALLASIFCACSRSGRNARRALKRVLALKKKHPDIVIELI